jgi:hypothetical protein
LLFALLFALRVELLFTLLLFALLDELLFTLFSTPACRL